jgi:DNA repair protein RadD
MHLRQYQQSAHDAAIAHMRKCVEPACVEAATGAGKSHIIAAIADTIHSATAKHVLCLAPSAELVKQNREKYLLTGNPASIYSASAGSKCIRHPVVFGTPGTVKNNVWLFGSKIALIIVDECHQVTPTMLAIIASIQECNPNVRVLGLSATPYRMNSGYVYATDLNGNPVPSKNPFYKKLIYRITAPELIAMGFLSPVTVGVINSGHYDTQSMALNARGQFDAADVDRAYHGHGRKTSAIIADVIAQSANRRGVMLFCATRQHAEEAMASLPPGISALVTGETMRHDRERIVKAFKDQQIKYLVNVMVFTVGFDAPHVDVIALLRATESVQLLQQIIGRGLRIDAGKQDCLFLDYAENIDRHAPDGDVLTPKIELRISKDNGAEIPILCPSCGVTNQFSARDNKDGFERSEDGYFLDLDGNKIETEYGPMPSHHGRRCGGLVSVHGGKYDRCNYRWTFKACPQCETDNDIAARHCVECRFELVDPGEKLVADFKRFKRDPSQLQTDKVIEFEIMNTLSQKGKPVTRVNVVTEYRTFSVWYSFQNRLYKLFVDATRDGKTPDTVTYKKDIDTGFYSIYAFGQPEDITQ